jgi:hypothetical protein
VMNLTARKMLATIESKTSAAPAAMVKRSMVVSGSDGWATTFSTATAKNTIPTTRG